ncbi:MAG TPA: ABC transporter ATP-binding protein [Dehalococcoidia bacterium]
MLDARDLRLGYHGRVAVHGVELHVERGELVALVGPNGSGKSTLLKGVARVLRPQAGTVYLDGKALARFGSRELARRLALLPQSPVAPDDVTVADLVWRGRYPHLGFLGLARRPDREAVGWAVRATGLAPFLDRPVSSLSGGERQRVWIAMALAQQPDVLLLDEPTTFLDIGHQLEVLHLLRRLNREQGLTTVLSLQDLNHAARFATRVVVLQDGRIHCQGPPAEVLRPDVLRTVFKVEAAVVNLPGDPAPLIVPRRPCPPEVERSGGPP